MKTLLFFLPVFFYLNTTPDFTDASLAAAGSVKKVKSKVSKDFFRFGDQLMVLEKHESAVGANYLLLGLHSDEEETNSAALKFAQDNGISFLQLKNGNKKNIEANFLDQKISFDPNHIFTINGRKKHLKSNKCWSTLVNGHVYRFAVFVLGEITPYKIIVSMHSDADQKLSDYEKAGAYGKCVSELSKQPSAGDRNFFVTNDKTVFERLKKLEFNVVLLDEKKMRDDGSLHVYCNKTGRSYIHIQTSADDRGAQEKMLEAADYILK